MDKSENGAASGSAGLKESQVYTLAFGVRCASLYKQWRGRVEPETGRFMMLDEQTALSDKECNQDAF